jgi:hypothetical protein
MQDVVIENPILNLPYEEATRHYCFSDEGITNEATGIVGVEDFRRVRSL